MSNSTLSRSIDFEALEDRLLFSATPMAAVDVPEKPDVETTTHGEVSADTVSKAQAAQSNTADHSENSTEATHDAVTKASTTEAKDVVAPVDVTTAPDHARLELIFVDSRVENSEGVAQSLMASGEAGVQFQIIRLDSAHNGLDQITAALSQYGTPGNAVDAIHLITHGDSGKLFVGGSTVTDAGLTSDTSIQASLAAWKPLLAENADILLYGCDVAEGANGQAFVSHLATLTGADVAASTNPTGSIEGSDWLFETTTGTIETAGLTSQLEFALDTANPVVTISAPSSVNIGETFDVTVSFDNTSLNGVGYGPFIDIFIDRTGTDGSGDGSTVATAYDGLTSITAPTYLGSAVTYDLLVLNDSANGGLGVKHPYLVDNTGASVYIKTTDAFLAGKYQQGDWLMVVQLPYGSFTSTQPAADITFKLGLSNLADVNMPVRIDARAGFQFGADALNNPAVDAPIVAALTGSSANVNASLLQLDKIYIGPENETATGPNYVRQYELVLDIAAGQTLTNVHVIDLLAAAGVDALQFVNLDSVTINGVAVSLGSGYTISSLPSTTTPGGTLDVVLNTVTGTTSERDAVVTFSFFVPRTDAAPGQGDAVVINASTGDNNLIENQAYTYGGWDPIDSRDPVIVVSDQTTVAGGTIPDLDPEHVLEAQSIAIQKDVVNIIRNGVSLDTGGTFSQSDWNALLDDILPGDVVEFAIYFQLSDYFAFQGITISDVMSDGLRLDNALVPAISINGNTYTLNSTDFSLGTNWTSTVLTDGIYNNGVASGNTNMVFDVSALLAANTGNLTAESGTADQQAADLFYAALGQLLGGGVNPLNPTGDIANNLAGYNASATTGRIVYRAIVQDKYTDTPPNTVAPSSDPSLNPRDTVNNSAVISGTVLDLAAAEANPNNSDANPNNNTLPSTGNFEDDDTAEVLTIHEEVVHKTIYAINGIIRLSDPLNANSAESAAFTSAYRTDGVVTGDVNIKPGDVVAYRITYVVPSGDVEQLRFSDFLPLPIFDVDDANSDGVSDPDGDAGGLSEWTFVDNRAGGGVINAPDLSVGGKVTYGPTYTLDGASGGTLLVPTLSVDSIGNSLTMTVGTQIDATNTSRIVDLILTVTVSNKAFADGLYLTNQVQSGERNTQSPAVESNANSIIQVVLNEPDVTIYKGVVASDKGPGQTAGGLTFNDIGANGFSGTLVGDANAALIGGLNLSSGALPDAGDKVRYALVVQNTGRSDAFDIVVQDTIRGSFVNNYADAATMMAATNFRVYDGAGNLLSSDADGDLVNNDYTVSWNAGTKTFQVTLIDGVTATDGALNRGIDMTQSATPATADGSNSIIILYDLTVDVDAQAASSIQNTATLANYAGLNGGENHIPGGVTETALIIIDAPEIVKTVTNTQFDNSTADPVGTNDGIATIGEWIEYTLIITLPEGVTAGSTIVDTLDAGMSFVTIDSVTYSSGVSSGNTPGTGTGGSVGNGPAFVTLGNVSGGTANQITFSFGNITNTDSTDGTLDTITIVYRAVVLNTTSNQAGTQLGNSASLGYNWVNDGTLSPLPAGGSDTITSTSAIVTVVEPHLNVDKTVSGSLTGTYGDTLNNADAGDAVYYKIVITNDSALTAYEISLNDALPLGAMPGWTVIAGSGANQTTSVGNVWVGGVLTPITAANFVIDGSGVLTFVSGDVDLAAGASITLYVQGTLPVSVHPIDTLNNDAIIKWSSLDGTVANVSIHNAASDERDGSNPTPPGTNVDSSTDNSILNNYAHSDRAAVVIDVPVSSKTIVATSESFTSGSSVAIGEIVRYQIIVRIPEGTSSNLQIVDQLPTGIVFINDGTATIRFNADSGSNDLSVAAFGGGSVGDGTLYTLSDTQISTDAASNNDDYNNGTAVRFKLGDVVNNNVNNSQKEYIIVEFNALVLNTTLNQAGKILTNTATTQINGTSIVGNTATVDATVAEANLAVTKTTAQTGPVDAGDTFSYTVTIANNASGGNATTAFDVRVQDAIDAIVAANPTTELNFLSYSLGALPSGTSILAGGDTSIYGVGGTLDLVFNRLDAGQSITITVNVQVKAGALAGAEIENKAVVTYTSLPGASGTTGANNVTYGTVVETAITSVLASADANNGSIDLGTAASERGGSDVSNPTNNSSPSDNSILNNYAVAASAPAGLTIATPTIDKQWQDGTLTNDDTSLASSTDNNVVIGERLTYDIVVTLPEGITDNLQIQDILPVGFRADSIQLINPNGVVFEFDPITGFTPVSGAGAALNLNFGDSTLAADGDSTNNTFTIRVTGTVENIAANQRLDLLAGAATLTYSDPDGAGNASDTPVTRTVNDSNAANNPTFTIQEPTVTIGKTVDFAGPNLDAGDTLTYTIELSNTSVQTAYEVTLNDALSSLLTNFGTVTATHLTPGDVSGEFEIVDAGGGNWVLRTVAGADIDLADGQTVTITFTANIVANIGATVEIANTAAIRWTSTDGSVTHPDERTGNDIPYSSAPTNANFDQNSSSLPVNNYAVSSSVVTEVTTEIVAAKTLVTNPSDINGSGNVTPGEIVTYQIVVTLPEGVASNFQIQDLIPPGMQYLSGSFVLVNQDSGVTFTVTPSLGAATAVGGGSFGDGTGVLFTFGEITVAATSGTADNTFTFTYQAVALDSLNLDGITAAGDGDGQTPHNNHASHNNGSGTSYSYDAGIVPLTAVEPRLTVTKGVNDSTPDIGDTVTFTLTIANLASNGSTTTAYDIRVRDLLPPGLITVGSVSVSGASITNNSTTGNVLDLVLDSLALGSSATITFTAIVENTEATVGDTIVNTVNIYYDNLPDDEGTLPETGNTANGETDGSTGDRDYTTTNNATLTVNAASIAGTVYHDANNDGVINAGETTRIAGVTITLTGTTFTGLTVSRSTTTDSDGNYLFDNLAQGVYTLTETQPIGYLDGQETLGTLFGGTVDNTQVNQPIIGITIPAQSTADAVSYNFGELLAATIAGTVYQDFDNDGVIDLGETGLEGVEIELTGTDDFGDSVTLTVLTNPDGSYSFTDLRPGTYTVTEVTQPVGYLDGKETAGSTGGTVDNTTDNNTITGIVVTGAGGAPSTSTNNNLGELDPASISGYVYLDLDNDGVKDALESGLANVSVNLSGTDDRGAAVNVTLSTDANGFYDFSNLRPGTYVVAETQPTGYTDGTDTLGSGFTPATGNNNGTTGSDTFTAITIANVAPGNNSGTNYNFGEQFNANLVKTIVATSEDHTTGTDLAIGEVVRYSLTFNVPYGTVYDVAVLDNFLQASGLQFLPDSVRISLIGSLTSSVAGLAGAGGPPDAVVSTDRATDVDTYASGTDAWFKLGNLTNANVDGSPAQVVIEFDALVVNEVGNQAGTTLSNEFQLSWDRTGNSVSTDVADVVGTSASVAATIVEPAISFDQVITADSDFDAGDTVTITLTISNSGASAFELALADILNGKFDLTGVVFDAGTTGAIWTYTGSTLLDTVTGTIDRLDEGESVTLTLTATIRETVNPSEVLGASATLSWSSLPDAGTIGGTNPTAGDDAGNDTLSTTPGATGEANGERNGGDGVGGTLNDYAAADTDSITIAEELLIVKSQIGGSITPQIGDVLTYQLEVSVIEGTTMNLSLVDQLPVSGSLNQLTYVAGTATITDANGMTIDTLGVSYNSSTNQLTLTSASILNPGLADVNTLATGTFKISYQVLVANVSTNDGLLPGQSSLENSVTATADGTTPPSASTTTVTVTEPALQVVKSVDDTTPDIGQTLDYTLVITHTGASTAIAYDVIVKDVLPTGLTLDLASILVNGVSLATSPLVNVSSDVSTASGLQFTLTQLALGQTVTITYQATLSQDHSYLGDTLDNNVRIYWDSQAGDDVNIVFTGDASDSTPDRDYGATGTDEVHNLDTQPEQDTVRVTVNNNTLAGTVYQDVNANGVFNSGTDTAIEGVTVTLTGTDINGNPVSLTQTTDASGNYLFSFVPPSDASGYVITETQPAAYLDALETVGSVFGGSVDNTENINVISTVVVPAQSNTSGTGYNFGEVVASTLSGSVYEDWDNDGIRDVAEVTGIAGIIITLTGTDAYGAVVSETTTTDADGNYTFTDLRPSNSTGYTLTEGTVPTPSPSGGYNDGKDTDGSLANGVTTLNDVISSINLNQEDGTDYNFGELPPASISGYVYNDLNGDGVKDVGELGIFNAVVTLAGIDDLGNAVIVTTTTNGFGFYEFLYLRPGTYIVTETQPSGFSDGLDAVGTGFAPSPTNNGTLGNDEISAINIVNVNPIYANGINYDFGEVLDLDMSKTIVSTSETATAEGTADTTLDPRTVAIGETIRYQIRMEIPEGTLGDVTLQDLLPDGLVFVNDGTATISFVNASGTGSITSSTLGVFVAANGTVTSQMLLDGSAISSDLANSQDIYVSGGDVYFHLGDLTSNQNDLSREYVVIEFTVLVADDLVNNHSGDQKENKFAMLYDADGDDLTPPTTAITLPDGEGPVVEIVEPKLVVTKINNDTNSVVYAGQFVTYTITVSHAPDSTATAFDVSLRDIIPTGTSYVVGSLQYSSGVVPTLTDVGGTMVANFAALEIGETSTITFQVQVSTAAKAGTTIDNNVRVSYDGLVGDDNNPNDPASPVTSDGSDRDYGATGTEVFDQDTDPHQDTERITIGSAVISDFVWFDQNGDKFQAGEKGIAGVKLNLYSNVSGVLTLIGSQTTDSNGLYAFRNLADGDFVVRVVASTLPDSTATVATYDYDGISTKHTAAVTLTEVNEVNKKVDFGYRGTGVIGDKVFIDSNNNGIFDGDDEGIGSVKVTLTWTNSKGGVISMTTTTDSSGNYKFENLFGGEYRIAVNATQIAENLAPVYDLDGVFSPHVAGLTLGAGSTRMDGDFGYLDPSSLVFDGVITQPGSLFGISFNTLSVYYQTTYDPTFDEWALPAWELVDSTPIFSSPLLSGHAEPGSKLVLALYNHQGELLSTSTVLVSSGGNWTVGFAGVKVNGPITIVSSVSSGDFTALSTDNNFNFRTNYITGLAGGYFQSRAMNVDSAFSSLAYERVAAMVAEDEKELTIGWIKNDYEFLAEPGLPGGNE